MKKPPDQVREEFARQWLLKAEEDLNAAKSLLSHGETFLSTVCFHSQQAIQLADKVRTSILAVL
jgi:HEPN domain-containing protein